MASISELWLVDFGDPYPAEPSSIRPALVVGPPDTFGPAFPVVFLVPLTTTRRQVVTHVEVEASGFTGLDVTSYVQCEMLRSVSSRRLMHRLGVIGWEAMDKVSFNIATLLDQ